MKQLDKNCYNNFVDKVKEAENCRVLWLTVLETALNDYCHGHDAKRLGRWIGGCDFQLVCHFAGVESDAMKKIFKKAKKYIDSRNTLLYNTRARYSRQNS